jgi:hypothetical protein
LAGHPGLALRSCKGGKEMKKKAVKLWDIINPEQFEALADFVKVATKLHGIKNDVVNKDLRRFAKALRKEAERTEK